MVGSTWDQERESGLSSLRAHSGILILGCLPFLGVPPGEIRVSVPSSDSAVRVSCAPPGTPPNPPLARNSGLQEEAGCLGACPRGARSTGQRLPGDTPSRGGGRHPAHPRVGAEQTELALLACLASVLPALPPAHRAPQRWAATRTPAVGAERPSGPGSRGSWRHACPGPFISRGRGGQGRRGPCHGASGGLPQLESKTAASKRPQVGLLVPSPAGPRAWDMAEPLPGLQNGVTQASPDALRFSARGRRASDSRD